MQQKVWNIAIALSILVVFLVLAITNVTSADSFVSVFFVVLAAIVGSFVGIRTAKFLGADRFPKLPPELAAIVILFIIALVAFIFQIFQEMQFLEASLAILAYTLGRS